MGESESKIELIVWPIIIQDVYMMEKSSRNETRVELMWFPAIHPYSIGPMSGGGSRWLGMGCIL